MPMSSYFQLFKIQVKLPLQLSKTCILYKEEESKSLKWPDRMMNAYSQMAL